MLIEELHWGVRNQFNKLNNSHNRGLTDVEIDNALNKAQRRYLDLYYYGSPTEGFENERRNLDMVSSLIKKESFTSTLKDVVRDKPKDYQSFIAGNFIQDECRIIINPEREMELNTVLNNYHRKPSNKFKRAIVTEDINKLYLYCEKEGKKDIVITYLKRPSDVRLGTYKDIKDNNLIPKMECEIPEQFQPLLIDIAVDYLNSIYNSQQKQVG